MVCKYDVLSFQIPMYVGTVLSLLLLQCVTPIVIPLEFSTDNGASTVFRKDISKP